MGAALSVLIPPTQHEASEQPKPLQIPNHGGELSSTSYHKTKIKFLCLHEVIYRKPNNSDILRDHKIVLSKYSNILLNPDELNRQKQVRKYFAESELQLWYIQNKVCNIERSIFFFLNDCVHGRVKDISTHLQNDLLNIEIIPSSAFCIAQETRKWGDVLQIQCGRSTFK